MVFGGAVVGLFAGLFQLVLGLHLREDAELAQSSEDEEDASRSSKVQVAQA